MKHTWVNPCRQRLLAEEAKDGVKRYCESNGCMWCDGGLEVCSVCNSFEASTTTHCPGAQMGWFTAGKVSSTDLDFVNGSWTRNVRKNGLISNYYEIRKHYPLGEQIVTIRKFHAGWEELPSMEKEKMSRGW